MFKVAMLRICLVVISLTMFACAQENILDSFKESVLEDHPTTTIGKAFDMYQGFSDVFWKHEQLANGTNMVIIRGEAPRERWAKDSSGIATLGIDDSSILGVILEFVFLIPPDGNFYLDTVSMTYGGENVSTIETICTHIRAAGAEMTDEGCRIMLTDDTAIDATFNEIYRNVLMEF